jgi:hypothetical protein
MKKRSDQLSDTLLGLRVFVIVGGLIALGLGWSAQSQGILWHTGRNARIGTETDAPTLSCIIYGVLLILAGILPWKWLSRRLKR